MAKEAVAQQTPATTPTGVKVSTSTGGLKNILGKITEPLKPVLSKLKFLSPIAHVEYLDHHLGKPHLGILYIYGFIGLCVVTAMSMKSGPDPQVELKKQLAAKEKAEKLEKLRQERLGAYQLKLKQLQAEEDAEEKI